MFLNFIFFGANLALWLFLIRMAAIKWSNNGIGRAAAFLS